MLCAIYDIESPLSVVSTCTSVRRHPVVFGSSAWSGLYISLQKKDLDQRFQNYDCAMCELFIILASFLHLQPQIKTTPFVYAPFPICLTFLSA